MNSIRFYKYQGAGNDFIIPDPAVNLKVKDNTKLIQWLCDRRFGIGADGLILWEKSTGVPFSMTYYNADGRESTLCGNGGRCISAFAYQFQNQPGLMQFDAIDGTHQSQVKPLGDQGEFWVRLQMPNVQEIKEMDGALWMNTGSPHHVEIVTDLHNFPVDQRGRSIRDEIYGSEGSNVNFVQGLADGNFAIRTYERGVEAETLACGTGVTAAALAVHHLGLCTDSRLHFSAKGGFLEVEFEKSGQGYKDIWLSGPATFVFEGEIELKKF